MARQGGSWETAFRDACYLWAVEPAPRVIQITDRHAIGPEEVLRRIEAARAVGPAFAVLFRDKDLPRADRAEGARELRAATRATGARLLVAADVDLALAVGADGVHLPSDAFADLSAVRCRLAPDAWLSVACHAPAEVTRAASAGANAALLSPIFQSPGKASPIGVEAIAEARGLLGDRHGQFCLVALGGIDEKSAPSCLAAGADAVASIRAAIQCR
jgi:thiamine-phosphate pyrophosphorylase